MKRICFLLLLSFVLSSMAADAQKIDISYQTGFTSPIKKMLPVSDDQVIVISADGGVLLWNRMEKKIVFRRNSSQNEVSDARLYKHYLLVSGDKGLDIFNLQNVLTSRQISKAATIIDTRINAISNGTTIRVATGKKILSFANETQLLNGTPSGTISHSCESIFSLRETGDRLYLLGIHQQSVIDTTGKKILSSSHYCTSMYGYDFAGNNTAYIAREGNILKLTFGTSSILATTILLKNAKKEELVQGIYADTATGKLFAGTNNQQILQLPMNGAATASKFYTTDIPASYTSLMRHGKDLLCGSFFGNVEAVDIASGRKKGELEEDPTPQLTGVYFNGKRGMITTHFGSRGCLLRFWDLSSAALQQSIAIPDHIAYEISFSRAGDTIYSHHTSGSVYRYVFKDNLYLIDTIKKPDVSFFTSAIVFRFDKDQRSLLKKQSDALKEELAAPGVHRYTMRGTSGVEWSFFNTEGLPRVCDPRKLPAYQVPDIFIAAAGLAMQTAAWDVMDRDLMYMRACGAETAKDFFSRMEKYQFDTARLGHFYRMVKGIEPVASVVSISNKNDGTVYTSFKSATPQHILVSSSPFILAFFDSDSIRIWRQDNNRIYSLPNTAGEKAFYYALNEEYIAFIPDGGNKISVVAYAKPQAGTSSWISFGADQYVVYTPEGYYKTKGRSNRLNMLVDEKAVSFSSFDLRYNRPDLVLASLNSSDTILMQAYKKAFDKRIKKAGVIDINPGKTTLPQLDITNSRQINYSQDNPSVGLQLKGKIYSPTGALHIWINEVPLFGKAGITFSNMTVDTSISIILSPGENRIEAALSDEGGMESSRTPFFVNYQRTGETERLYFVGIGINRFADSAQNLRWSVKDIRDLTATLQKKYGERMIIVDTLFDERVTAEKIISLKEKLKAGNHNDKVVIAYSGHGLLDQQFDYYLSTYAIDFRNPSKKGLPYEQLEDLLDGIPQRRKLLLIDACHSGEVDKEEFEKINRASGGLATKGIITKGGITEATDDAGRIGLQNSFELMQSLFINVGRGTGATIISAAAGTQFAQERGALRNGVFTYALLEALNQQTGGVRISTLRQHVSRRVEQLTNGLQQPTSRQETSEYDWEL
jgi:hypothetical protein